MMSTASMALDGRAIPPVSQSRQGWPPLRTPGAARATSGAVAVRWPPFISWRSFTGMDQVTAKLVQRLLAAWRHHRRHGDGAFALLAAGACWLACGALVNVRIAPAMPFLWVFATPAVVAATRLPPAMLAALAFATPIAYTLIASGQVPALLPGLHSTGLVLLMTAAALVAYSLLRTHQETQRREAEARLLQEFDRFRSELLTMISHELRTPLTVVHGYAQYLEAKAATCDPASVAQIASRIRARSAELARLIEELVSFERLERGDLTLMLRDFDLVPLLRELASSWRRQPGGERLVLEAPDHLVVHGDPLRLRQVVAHLVQNALQYAPEREVILRAWAMPARIRVEVQDYGPGIPRDEQHRIWEKLYRGRRVAGMNVARGSGLGLAIVKTLVEAHGGRVGLESALGAGARFWLELPAARPSAESSICSPSTGVSGARVPGHSG